MCAICNLMNRLSTKNLASDPRYNAILRQLNLPE